MEKENELNWIEKILIDNADKVREIGEKLPKNERSGKIQTVENKDKLTLFTKVDHVSKSGMTRWISLYIVSDGEIITIMSLPRAEKAGLKFDRKKDSWKMTGCGMDMGFALVYDIALRYGFKEGDFQNGIDMGYSITQRWI